MSAAHTPGPWTVGYETDITGMENDPKNGCVGLVDIAHVYLRTVPGRHEANARLIAAAPELLEFAQRALIAANKSDSTEPLLDWIADAASAVIHKATGEQP